METKELLSEPRHIVRDRFGIIAAFTAFEDAEMFVTAYNSQHATQAEIHTDDAVFLVRL